RKKKTRGGEVTRLASPIWLASLSRSLVFFSSLFLSPARFHRHSIDWESPRRTATRDTRTDEKGNQSIEKGANSPEKRPSALVRRPFEEGR
ncbi:hypothetical protein PFISCL1PPCAC_24894, partial [Pristionchus fissidentatus]